MKKLIVGAILMLILVNTAVVIANQITGDPFVFSPLLNVIAPILTALAGWKAGRMKPVNP